MNLPDTGTLSPDEYDALLADQDWHSLSRRLTEFAYRKINRTSWEDAEDLAQSAVRQVFDPSHQRWNPKAQPNIFWFLGHVVHGLISNRRKKNLRDIVVLSEQEDLEELHPEAIEGTDEVMARRERARLIVEELGRQAKERTCALVLAAFTAEIDDPRAQSESTKLTMQEVYNARHKLRALALAIAHTFDAGSEEPRTLQ
jgi:DNA-directed RNA polymerase specialized sigma24 family protein